MCDMFSAVRTPGPSISLTPPFHLPHPPVTTPPPLPHHSTTLSFRPTSPHPLALPRPPRPPLLLFHLPSPLIIIIVALLIAQETLVLRTRLSVIGWRRQRLGWMGWEGTRVGEMRWLGMGWDGMAWHGMGWDGMGWDGVGLDGMGWYGGW